MGTKYSSQSASGYNSSPPSDDGTASESNKVKWSTVKTKLSDPVKTLAEAVNTALVTALDQSARSVSASDSAAAADHDRVIQVTTASVIITLADAATMASGYITTVKNNSTGNITVILATASDTIDTATNATDVIGPYAFRKYVVNSSQNGYLKVGGTSLYDLIPSAPPGQGVLLNGKVTATHNASTHALTLAVKGADGNDPSASNPVFVAFRSATLTDGAFTVRKITGAMSLVVSSGSTLGHASAKACHAFVYLIDYNSGTVELAVSNLPPDYPGVFANTRLISTTAEGGAGAADSATGIYSTTARSNVPWVCVAKILTTQTTAGTWDSAVTQLDQAPFSIQTCAFAAYASSMSVNNATATKLPISSEIYDPDSTWDAVTNYRHQPSVAGVYRYSFNAKTGGMGANNQGILYIQKNGASDSLNSDEFYCMWNTGISPGSVATRDVLMNGTSDYVEFKVYQSDGAARNFNATGEGARVSGGQ